MYAQAYFDYDSKKSGGVTMSHLRFGKSPIKSTYLIKQANFVACHNPSYINKYNMVQELVDGGTFLLNCPWDMEGLEKHLPGQVKSFIANHNIKFYVIDGIKIGKEIGLGGRINTVLQSAFFKLANIIPEEHAIELMKAAAKATYGRKGDAIVQMNYDAIDAGAKQVVEVQVPESWKSCADEGLVMAHAESGREEQPVGCWPLFMQRKTACASPSVSARPNYAALSWYCSSEYSVESSEQVLSYW